ncbi:response regulator transcription factor [Streptomyces sp. NPDC001928]|uniref:response regulator transcription factor n=1 Tax=Streptomyces sp. NPDC001928 TaxID=3154404 RepID=UPI003332ECC2
MPDSPDLDDGDRGCASCRTPTFQAEALAAAMRVLEAALTVMQSLLGELASTDRPDTGTAGPVTGWAGSEAVVSQLTKRERQVLELLAQGLSNRAISAELGIAERTVKNHVQSIFTKLGTHTRTETVHLALTGRRPGARHLRVSAQHNSADQPGPFSLDR